MTRSYLNKYGVPRHLESNPKFQLKRFTSPDGSSYFDVSCGGTARVKVGPVRLQCASIGSAGMIDVNTIGHFIELRPSMFSQSVDQTFNSLNGRVVVNVCGILSRDWAPIYLTEIDSNA